MSQILGRSSLSTILLIKQQTSNILLCPRTLIDSSDDTRLSTYLVHYDLALGWLGHVDHLLHHVVGVLILHHGV